MCLVTKQREPLIAEEDIIVYKVFTKDDKSPYQKFDYTPYIGKLFTDTAIEEIACIKYFNGNFIEAEVSGGFIHSYSHLNRALIVMFELSGINLKQFKIRKCIVPKGTKYYVNECKSEIASKSIIIGEEVIEYVPNNS